MKFEERVISFKPKPLLEDRDTQRTLLEKKHKLVDHYRPDEMSFTDIYQEEEIKKDLAGLEEIKAKWSGKDEREKSVDNISMIYEGIISDQISANGWFGDNCEAIPASSYDNIKNGIDVVTIFDRNQSKQYLGLGIDVTFSSDKKILEEKLESIKQCIRKRVLPSLKYFQDPETGEHKKIFLTKIVIGSRLSTAEKLIRTWGSKDENRNKKLAQDPVSSKIILESIAQLKYFYDFALQLSKGDQKESEAEEYRQIAVEYARMYNTFCDIYETKEEQIKNHLNDISDDIVYETILEFTQGK